MSTVYAVLIFVPNHNPKCVTYMPIPKEKNHAFISYPTRIQPD